MSTTRNIDNTYSWIKSCSDCSEMSPDAQMLKGKTEYKITPSIMHITIQTVQNENHTEKKMLRSKSIHDMRTSRIKDAHGPSTDIRNKNEKRLYRCKKTSRLIFPEMQGGILYSRCCCLHRDCLQDCCPLSQCQGQPECLAKPWAICLPGKFVRLRHPELYPKAFHTNCVI